MLSIGNLSKGAPLYKYVLNDDETMWYCQVLIPDVKTLWNCLYLNYLIISVVNISNSLALLSTAFLMRLRM